MRDDYHDCCDRLRMLACACACAYAAACARMISRSRSTAAAAAAACPFSYAWIVHAYVHAYASWPRAMHGRRLGTTPSRARSRSRTTRPSRRLRVSDYSRERRVRIFARILESASRPRIDPNLSTRRRVDGDSMLRILRSNFKPAPAGRRAANGRHGGWARADYAAPRRKRAWCATCSPTNVAM